jgi:hypothetical protein
LAGKPHWFQFYTPFENLNFIPCSLSSPVLSPSVFLCFFVRSSYRCVFFVSCFVLYLPLTGSFCGFLKKC